jgi:O-antigen ligase
VLVLAAANLVWTVLLDKNELMLSSMPNMHGQILVGISLMLIYRAIQVRQNAGLMWFAVAVLLCSLFFGSTRRTGYVLFLAGGLLLIVLSYRQHQYQKSKFFWACAGMLLALVLFTLLSSKFQHRMILIFSEYQEFFQLPEYERSKLSTSVGLRLQYLVSALQIVREHLFFGVGSITFKPLFWEVNHAMGATNPVIFAPNPHNEYLYTWATKGLVGIILYLAIFFQACRIAAKRMSTWQRHGMWLFVCIFLLSIMFNSMSIDMIEGHFMMLVLLSFLAPRHIWSSDVKENVSRK